mgnify:CR=1 FL=1
MRFMMIKLDITVGDGVADRVVRVVGGVLAAGGGRSLGDGPAGAGALAACTWRGHYPAGLGSAGAGRSCSAPRASPASARSSRAAGPGDRKSTRLNSSH